MSQQLERRHTFFTNDYDGKSCSRCGKPPSEGDHFPAKDSDRCECSGCWGCAGNVLGCTCDVDWDKVFGHE